MTRSEFTKAMKAKGWLVWKHKAGSGRTAYVCECKGCPGTQVVTDNQIARGELPHRCRLPHVRGHARHVMDSQDALQRHLRNRRVRLGLSQEDVEAAAGLTVDHIGKLEVGLRNATFPTFWAWAEALGFEIVLQPKALPDQVLAIIDHKAGQPIPERRAPACLLLPDASEGAQSLTLLEDIA